MTKSLVLSNKIIFKVIEYIPHPVGIDDQMEMAMLLEDVNITRELVHELE